MIKTSEHVFEPQKPVVPPGWDVLPFEQAAYVVSDKGKRVKQGSYLLTGKIPVIDQGQDTIGGYTDDEDMAFDDELPVILFGDHTRSLKYVDKRFAVGAEGVKILRPRDEYVPKFFYYLLRSLQIPSRGYSRHFQFLRKFYLPLAPAGQQHRIVAEIEKQFSRLDEAVANLKRVKANLKRYKAAVLKAAVEGKLTEDWRKQHPNVEPASELLERILTERRAKWNRAGNYKELAMLDTTGLPLLPNNWKWASLDQLLLNITDGDHQPPPQTDSGVPFLVIGNVRSGKLEFEDTRFVSRQYADAVNVFRKPTRGDILYTLVGSFGIALRVDADREFCIQRHIGALRSHKLSPTSYLVHVLNSLFVFSQATNVATGTAQKTVPLAGLRRFAIPLAPLAEQQQIVAEVERRLSVIEELEAAFQANLTRAERLRQSVLRSAFSGGLVDRNKPTANSDRQIVPTDSVTMSPF